MIGTSSLPSVGIAVSLLGACFLGLQSLSVRYGTTEASSFSILFFVLLMNSVVFVPIALLFGDPVRTLDTSTVGAFLGVSFFGLLMGRAFHFKGIQRVGASRTDAIKASQPLHASLIAVVVLGEIVTVGHLTGMVAIVFGISLISLEFRNGDQAGGSLFDLGIPLLAALFYGISPTFVAIGLGTGVSIWTGLAIMSVGGVIPLAVVMWQIGNFPRFRSFDRREQFWFLVAGGFNTVFITCYYFALRAEPVSLVVPLFQLSPLIVLGLSALFVRDDLERVTWRLLAAALIVVAGAICVTVFSGA